MEPRKSIPKLINLTSNELSPDQIYILSKGLKFTPTPQKSNYTEIQDDISNFCRKLRLTEEFFDQDNEDGSLVLNKSDYTPPRGSVANYKQQKIIAKLIVLVNLYRKGLTKKECDYITNFKCKTSQIYGLPKIHKSQKITEACKLTKSSCINICAPNDLKMRPIFAGPACETHTLSIFLDILLKPFLKHISSFIRDDLDMLNHLPNNVEGNTIIVSFHVVSLYTIIPHKYGIEAINYWIEKYKTELPNRIDKKIIIEGLRFIFQNNYFMFDNQMYRQKSGTAIGTKVVPTYANLVMGYLEIQMYRRSKRKFGHLFYKFLMENWKRYLDDCFILWNHSLDMLIEFKDLLNETNENIQFTMECNSNQLPFLDILIIKNGTNIETDIFYKPTDSKQYLLFTSCHPKHTRTGSNLLDLSYDFDAFVSYAEEDQHFVHETFLTNIKEGAELRVCLHKRDFLVGNEIAANITDAIHRSRKTVCIITIHFLNSYWCMFEFNMARIESIYSRDGENIVYLIFLEQIPAKTLPLVLLELVQSQSYVEFPNDEYGDTLFWDNLKKVLCD
ncbi:Toll-like receptor 4 [Mytilus coruscus]|uniref:Toll-like receptor 4 n=1 Tax=Mytilus coruscus TaxID=42192 RepID=A0A6J8B7D2_MYTCO|nr:Toll-like receptor 4 [Mytilus coruscus]